MYAIVDCNNFFASCERVFRPQLEQKPVVVLSNNDGCIISRSNEAKAIGVKMGAPYFQIRTLLEVNDVAVFSSNYELYGDLSRRVMETLKTFTPEVEIYSIDEAFLDLDSMLRGRDPVAVGREMKAKVEQWTGIPVSIGIAPTKTLAKVANDRVVKRYKGYKGVFHLDSPERIEKVLKATPVIDVWGIGRRLAKMLNENGIYNGLELHNASDAWVRKKMGVTGLRTLHELRGIPCFMDDVVPEVRKNLLFSRSFGNTVDSFDDLREAVCTFAASAAAKLRRQKSATAMVYVFVRTREDVKNRNYGSEGKYMMLPTATDSTSEILRHAVQLLEKIYRGGEKYKSAGVMLGAIVPRSTVQLNAFDNVDRSRLHKADLTVDRIRDDFGSDAIHYASMGFHKSEEKAAWMPRIENRSPNFTTRIREGFEISS